MKIAVIGAGNNGCAIAADLARDNEVYLYSTKPEMFDGSLVYRDSVSGEEYTSRLMGISNDYKTVVENARCIFIALPTFLINKTVNSIAPFVNEGAVVGFVPGAGGVEYLSQKLIDKGITIFGFERVPYVARLEEYGKIVSASKKDKYRIAAMPQRNSQIIADMISQLFDRPCSPMSDFISMTLTPTLHVCRLYDLYKDYAIGTELTENPFFYGDWRDSASYICFELDKELHEVTSSLQDSGINTRELVPYFIHYESPTEKDLTKKLRSIQSLNKIKGPLITLNNGNYMLDVDSRYFTESFPYRLCIVKGLACITGTSTPLTDQVLKWYEVLSNKEYFINSTPTGKDIMECNIPQNYGLYTIQQLLEFYSR